MGPFKMPESDSFYHAEAERFFNEAYERQMSGAMDEAVDLYKKSIELYPTAEAHTFLGWVYSVQGFYDKAIRECHSAIKIDPDFGNPYNDIGAYLIEKGKFDEAVPWLEKAAAAKRYDSYCYPYYNLGRIAEQKGDWGKALRNYRQALIENADYKLARRALNRVQAMMN
jgi:Tfp pilus assembly protein PilF